MVRSDDSRRQKLLTNNLLTPSGVTIILVSVPPLRLVFLTKTKDDAFSVSPCCGNVDFLQYFSSFFKKLFIISNQACVQVLQFI